MSAPADPTAVLRHVEWIPAADYSPDYCPVCDGERADGHATDCALAVALESDPTAEVERLRAEVERLTSERDAALADAAKLRGVLRGILREAAGPGMLIELLDVEQEA